MPNQVRLPILPLRDPELIVFPGLFCEVDVGRVFSLNAILESEKNQGCAIAMAIQRDPSVDDPGAKDLLGMCTIAEIKSVLPLDREGTRVRAILCGTMRGSLKTVGKSSDGDDAYLVGQVEPIELENGDIDDDTKDAARHLREMVVDHLKHIGVSNDSTPTDRQSLSDFVDNIAGQLAIPGKRRLLFLKIKDPAVRLEKVRDEVADLCSQADLEYGDDASDDISDPGEVAVSELKKLQKRVSEANMPEHALKVARSELRRLSMMPPSSSEFQVTYNYVDNLASLPWSVLTEDNLDISVAEDSLNEDHYGLEKPKERILEYLAVKKLLPAGKGPILCFSGPPGTGKTSLGKSIAKAMGRKFIRVSLGGVNDEAEIRGHRRTYVGALPGKIIQCIQRAGSRNPVFMLDEIDKLCSNFRGDPSSALLEMLDSEQNHSFSDHYLGVPFDLSQVLFIGTANEISPIIPALRDRMEIIDLPGYSPFDKVKIAQHHLIRKQKEENGLKDVTVNISANAIGRIVDEYTSEAGVRSLERECGTIMRKIAVAVASEKEYPSLVKIDMVPKFLGPPKIFAEKAVEKPEVGLSAGLAWSKNGGSLLFVETSLVPGKGKIKLTGSLGNVLKESANAAYTWIKSNAGKLDVDLEKIGKYDIHIHFPAGAVPKDGPSAGIAIAASMLSIMSDKPVRNDVAMTGEITLRGRVLPIGGLKEKILAAHRAGIKEVLYPKHNKHDVTEVPNDVVNDMALIPVANLDEALEKVILNEVIDEPSNGINTGDGEKRMNMEM